MEMYTHDLAGFPDLLTSAEVAGLFRVNPKTVSRWAVEGRLPESERTPGGHRRWRKDVIWALLADRRP